MNKLNKKLIRHNNTTWLNLSEGWVSSSFMPREFSLFLGVAKTFFFLFSTQPEPWKRGTEKKNEKQLFLRHFHDLNSQASCWLENSEIFIAISVNFLSQNFPKSFIHENQFSTIQKEILPMNRDVTFGWEHRKMKTLLVVMRRKVKMISFFWWKFPLNNSRLWRWQHWLTHSFGRASVSSRRHAVESFPFVFIFIATQSAVSFSVLFIIIVISVVVSAWECLRD